MTIHVGTGKASAAGELLEAFARGRNDPPFFTRFFMGRTMHDGQIEFMKNSQATINALATANRWGKTTVMTGLHYHAGTYKTGAEDRYFNPDGTFDFDIFTGLKYTTIHTAGEWEQVQDTWQDALKVKNENVAMQALVANAPLSKPPHIELVNGSKWLFRTLGHDASGVDGKSIYLLSIDEAGWITNLDTMMANVLRVRVADVRGRIVIVGTFKPGISRDFYKIAVRASAYTGRAIGFAHASDETDGSAGNLDSAIAKYLAEFGIDISEYRDAMERSLR